MRALIFASLLVASQAFADGDAYESLGPIETRVISDWAGILVRAS